MLKAHCILFYKSGMRAEHFADSQREIEKIMEQAGRQARKRGDEILYHATGCAQEPPHRATIEPQTPQAAKSSLQLPNAPFDE